MTMSARTEQAGGGTLQADWVSVACVRAGCTAQAVRGAKSERHADYM